MRDFKSWAFWKPLLVWSFKRLVSLAVSVLVVAAFIVDKASFLRTLDTTGFFIGVFGCFCAYSFVGAFFLRVPLSARNNPEFYRENRKSTKGCSPCLYASARYSRSARRQVVDFRRIRDSYRVRSGGAGPFYKSVFDSQ